MALASLVAHVGIPELLMQAALPGILSRSNRVNLKSYCLAPTNSFFDTSKNNALSRLR
jgi:hypothetical protein